MQLGSKTSWSIKLNVDKASFHLKLLAHADRVVLKLITSGFILSLKVPSNSKASSALRAAIKELSSELKQTKLGSNCTEGMSCSRFIASSQHWAFSHALMAAP